MEKGIQYGGMVEFCDILKLQPFEIFSNSRNNKVRLRRGMLVLLWKRSGMTLWQMKDIIGLSVDSIKRSMQYALEQIDQRNPIAVDWWNKVKHIEVSRQNDVREMYLKELENEGVFFDKDANGILIKPRLMLEDE